MILVEPPFDKLLKRNGIQSLSLLLAGSPSSWNPPGKVTPAHSCRAWGWGWRPGLAFGNSGREASNINQRSHLNAIKWHFPLPPGAKERTMTPRGVAAKRWLGGWHGGWLRSSSSFVGVCGSASHARCCNKQCQSSLTGNLYLYI